MKKIILALLLTMTMAVTIAMTQIEANSEDKKQQSKTMLVITMQPGEKKQIVLDVDESVTFEFQLPKPGSCKFSMSSKSPDVAELKIGSLIGLIKKDSPLVIIITRDAKNTKPKEKVVNVTGKKTTPINFELSKIFP